MMITKRSTVLGATLVLAMGLVACGPPAGPSTRVQRIDPNAQVDLSGNWNDTDANMVARSMIRDCLSRPWLARYKAKHGKEPVIRLYPIKNRSDEHINWRYFTKQVEMELINAGIQVVADLEEAQDNRLEREDQAHHASDETVKSQGKETGSDFILNGWILTENDAVDGKEVRAYITTMELVDTETNVKAWMHVKKIKKVVSRAASEW